MKPFDTLFITGCGGDIPIALARIARQERLCGRLVGSDIHDDHPGPAYFDRCLVLPRADHPDYFDALATTLNREKASLLVIGSEPELRAFHRAGIDRVWERMNVIMASRQALQIGLDKLDTARFLESKGLPSPWTVPASQSLPKAYPCIAKDREGSGSRTIKIVETEQEAISIQRSRPAAIFQERLLPDDQEYTCGLYRNQNGSVRTIAFRRTLQGGLTGKGQVVENPEIDRLLHAIAEGLDLRGSINVQLRLTSRGPVVFEINPRFSSTVLIRHLLGFQDLVWSLRETLGLEPGEYRPPRAGTKFYRTSNEVILGGHTE